MTKTRLAAWRELVDRTPFRASVEGVDLLVTRDGDEVSVLYGRCHHKGAPLANGTVVGRKIACAWHGWGYRYDTGECDSPGPPLAKFNAWVENEQVWIDADEVRCWRVDNPEPCPGA